MIEADIKVTLTFEYDFEVGTDWDFETLEEAKAGVLAEAYEAAMTDRATIEKVEVKGETK